MNKEGGWGMEGSAEQSHVAVSQREGGEGAPPRGGLPHPSSFILHPSPVRAWLYLVWLSWQRQARARQMVWIALVLLAITAVVVGLITAADRWAPASLTQRVVAGGTIGWLASPGAPGPLLAASAAVSGEGRT